MYLTNNETKFMNKVVKIINKNEIKDAVKIISKLKFENKEIGIKKAKQFCIMYVAENISDNMNKPDNYNYGRELNSRIKKINSV
jgi:hypothetical protein